MLQGGPDPPAHEAPPLDALLDKGRATLDEAERRAIYGRAAALIKEEAPHLPMLQPPLLYGASARLDWTPRTDSMIDLRKARLS